MVRGHRGLHGCGRGRSAEPARLPHQHQLTFAPTEGSGRREAVRTMHSQPPDLERHNRSARAVQPVWPPVRHPGHAHRGRGRHVPRPRPDPGRLPTLGRRRPVGAAPHSLLARPKDHRLLSAATRRGRLARQSRWRPRSSWVRVASTAAPMIPAAFSRLAGTMRVRRSSSGRNFCALREIPPPTTMRSGHSRSSR